MPAHDAERLAEARTTSTPVETWSEYSPLSSCGMPHANSTTSRPRMHLAARRRRRTLPCSAETIRRARRRARSTSSRNANMTCVRRLSDASLHVSNAVLRRRARPRRRRRARRAATSACCCAGRRVVDRARCGSSCPAVSLPPIQCSMVVIVGGLALLRGQVVPLGRAWRRRRSRARARVDVERRRPRRPARPTTPRESGAGDQRVGLDVDDGGAGRRRAPRAARLELGDRAGAQDVGAEARGVGREVDRQDVAVESPVARRGSGSWCRSAASRATRTARRSTRSRGSGPGRSMSLMPSATAVTISWAIIR